MQTLWKKKQTTENQDREEEFKLSSKGWMRQIGQVELIGETVQQNAVRVVLSPRRKVVMPRSHERSVISIGAESCKSTEVPLTPASLLLFHLRMYKSSVAVGSA